MGLAATMLSTGMVFASDVDVSVVDVTVPTNSVTLAPGASGNITIKMSVSGNQAGTATFEVYRNWTLSGGSFAGSNPQEFTVGPRSGGDPATTFSTTGTVTVAAGQAAGTFTLAAGAFDITNSNQNGGKLAAGDASNYEVTVAAPPPPTDTTPPVISPIIVGTPGNNGWYTSNVTVSWSVVDGQSSISSSTGCGSTTISADTAGTTLTCSATSAGGTASESVTIKRDATAPVVMPGNVVNTTWRNSDLSQAFTATDAMSGLADSTDASFTLTASLESASATVATVDSRTISDLAGNATTRTLSALIDLTDPTITGAVAPAAADGSSGWYISAPTVTFTCGDALSGVAGCLADGESGNSKTLGESASAQSVSGTATDTAGNTATASVSDLKVDLSDPTNVAFAGGPAANGAYYFGSVPTAPTCTADDAISGMASCAVTGYSSAVGTHTMTATATDNAGRAATATRTYTVLAWTIRGFLQPVDMGMLNNAKAGSTVPLKFEVFAGSTELTDVAIVDTFYQKVACQAGTGDDIEQYATGNTTLRYDSTGGQFIFNWKTPTTKGCYRVTMTTLDGSSIAANFNLR